MKYSRKSDRIMIRLRTKQMIWLRIEQIKQKLIKETEQMTGLCKWQYWGLRITKRQRDRDELKNEGQSKEDATKIRKLKKDSGPRETRRVIK
jgi:hypothetical protein